MLIYIFLFSAAKVLFFFELHKFLTIFLAKFNKKE